LSQHLAGLGIDRHELAGELAAGSTRGIETEIPPLLLGGSRRMSAEPAQFGFSLRDGAMVLLTAWPLE
jgi:hypothetical protein